jgi:hypothetical protein
MPPRPPKRKGVPEEQVVEEPEAARREAEEAEPAPVAGVVAPVGEEAEGEPAR